jgi:hypothetical protein
MDHEFLPIDDAAKVLGISSRLMQSRLMDGRYTAFISVSDLRVVVEGPCRVLPPFDPDLFPDVIWTYLGIQPTDDLDPGSQEAPHYALSGWVAVTPDSARKVGYSKVVGVGALNLQVVAWPAIGEHKKIAVKAPGFDVIFAKGLTLESLHVSTRQLREARTTDQGLDPRERRSLLRIIRALDVMAQLPPRGAASSVESQIQQLGFAGPGEETIRKLIDEARALAPDKSL